MFFLNNGRTCIYFDRGKFDSYCVYVNRVGYERCAPTDDIYFKWIKGLAHRYGVIQVYTDFCLLYDIVDDKINKNKVIALVSNLDLHYNENTIIWWLIFYMTMVAECKKKNAILKKRIKKLGVYNILIENESIDDVVQYMRGKKWQELDELMKERGI